ncbi:MAG: bifunctional DNA primase/polymerase [Anaerolineae bacterium]|nr:bifunctional DNA primase/polymerase [Anaerolineae bacterium]
MSLLSVMLCPLPREAALGYLGLGISIIPLNGKKPPYRWERYQHTRATSVEAKRWWHWNATQNPNIGIICGRVSGNLVVLDLDGENAVESFEGAFPDLCGTLSVRTMRGMHLYYYTNEPTATTRVLGVEGNFELRSEGLYVVAPPSIHPESKHPYMVARPLPPLHLPDLRQLQQWLIQRRQQTAPQRPAKPSPVPTGAAPQPNHQYVDKRGNPIRNGRAYARYALSDESGRVSRSQTGSRAIALNTAAFRMGQLAARGWIDYPDVESELLRASSGWSDHDLDERARQNMIQTGYQSGMGKAQDRA